MIGGQATRRWISRAPPRSRISCTRARMVVDRTMLSSTSKTRLPAEDLGQGRVLEPGLGGAVGRSLDERPAHVAVAHQALDRGNLQREGHRIGRGLGRCRAPERRSCRRRAAPSPAGPAPCRARIGSGRPIDRRACWRRWRSRSTRRSNVPASATVRNVRSARPSALATASVPGSSERMFRKPRLASGTLSLAAPNSGPCSAMQSGRKPSGSRATTSSP